MLQNVRNIIFDLGNVLLNIDYALTQQAFQKLGIQNVQQLYDKTQQTKLFDKLETGKIEEEEFVAEIKKLCPAHITTTEIIKAWNALLLDFPIRRLQILQQLQLHYSIFLLSNTNCIHEKEYNKILERTCGYPTLNVFFDKVYLSHRVGMRKPNKEIYELVLHENNLTPEETLFIDDLLPNIVTAQQLGIQTIHLTNGMTIEKDIFKPKENV